jgi:transcriptional regulator with XRE-family HTH domain
MHPRRSYPIRPERLRQARENEALSQESLAAAIGAHRVSISEWECGTHAPQPRHVRALADRLHVTVPWLRGLN